MDIVNKDIGQNKNNQGNVIKDSSKNSYNVDFFGDDQSFIFIYKKTEKLATALYMVTNLFGDSEPMKWTLRSKVSSLLSFVLSFKDILKFREEEFLNILKTNVLEIVSLLEISNFSGLVSDMNFRILKDEFLNLINFASSLEKTDNSNVKLGLRKNFFDVFVDKNKVDQNTNFNDKRQYISDPQIKDTQSQNSQNTELTKKSNRQNTILSILSKNDNITIGTISQFIKDCSEKTIQRELINLIDRGLVKKTGERRWSRYSLVKN